MLLSSAGVALSEQLCLMTGIKQLESTTETDECCKEPASDTSETSDCCTKEISFAKLEPVSGFKYFQVTLLTIFQADIKQNHVTFPVKLMTDTRLYTYADSSPPLYGRSLLLRSELLLI